jgi:transcriptional regulator with XRE-family HTH domain
MDQESRAGEIIQNVRLKLGKTQKEFGDILDLTQSRVSEIEGNGPSPPTTWAWLKLGELAAGMGDNEAAAFFWQQTGIPPESGILLARALIGAKQADAGPLLPAVEAILKERLADAKELEKKGKIVPVPYDKAKDAPLPPLLLPAWKVPNVGSTFYTGISWREFVGHLGKEVSSGIWVVYDATGAPTRCVEQFMWGMALFDLQPPLRASGLTVGTLRLDGPEVHFSPVAPTGGSILLGAVGVGSGWLPRGRPRRGLHGEPTVLEDWLRPAATISGVALPEPSKIMGRVIALFPGEAPDVR